MNTETNEYYDQVNDEVLIINNKIVIDNNSHIKTIR